MMLIIGGIIQFGIILWGLNSLNQVVRDTGRWAATQQECDTDTARDAIVATANDIAETSSLIGYTTDEFAWGAGGDTTISWRGDPCPPNNNQDEAWVTVTINHSVPIFFPFVPGNGQLTSSAEFRMEPAPQ